MDFVALARRTPEFTSEDLRILCVHAAMAALPNKMSQETGRIITMEHFEAALGVVSCDTKLAEDIKDFQASTTRK